jgi:hypothetical protein
MLNQVTKYCFGPHIKYAIKISTFDEIVIVERLSALVFPPADRPPQLAVINSNFTVARGTQLPITYGETRSTP